MSALTLTVIHSCLCSNTVFNKTLRSAIAVLPVGAQVGSPARACPPPRGARGSDTNDTKGGGERRERGRKTVVVAVTVTAMVTVMVAAKTRMEAVGGRLVRGGVGGIRR
jgi:hypothetical protein